MYKHTLFHFFLYLEFRTIWPIVETVLALSDISNKGRQEEKNPTFTNAFDSSTKYM